MTGVQLAALAGVLIGAGVALLVLRLAPAHPDLIDALDQLSPDQARRSRRTGQDGNADGSPAGGGGEASTARPDLRERLGSWALRSLPAGVWLRTPTRELALLRITPVRFYGEKVLYAAVGVLIPPMFAWFLTVLGWSIPLTLPVAGTVGFAALMFFLPDYNVRDEAKHARIDFSRALGAYIDLVALERNSGSGSRQAMEVASLVGDSWVFQRLSEELARSRWSGVPPWDALHDLAEDLGLPELDELADMMRLSGEEGAQIYTNLRARAAAMRTSMLNAELGRANEIGEKMSIPMSLLGVIFMGILVAPSLLRVLGGGQ